MVLVDNEEFYGTSNDFVLPYFSAMAGADVSSWSCEDVGTWLKEHNFENYEKLFHAHKIDGSVLLCIQESDLRQPPMQLDVLGDIKKLYTYIKKLQIDTLGEVAGSPLLQDNVDGLSYRSISATYVHRPQRLLSNESISDDGDEIIDVEVERIVNRTGRYTKNVDPELFKTALSFIYVFLVFLVTSFIMTIVHDRVPDPQKYPPLPDLFLDNLPYIPWAFEVCEMVGVILFSIWAGILFFHKHR